MPDRIIRDELLSSERYWSLSSDTARMLFCHLLLRADDLGIFRASNYTVRSTCFGLHSPTPDALSKMLSELNDCDLIRLYAVDLVDYGFIPRFRQRLRIIKTRFPLPPIEARDTTIKELIQKMSDGSQASVGHVSAEEKRSEEKGREEKQKPRAGRAPSMTSIPPDFGISDRVREWAAGKGYKRLPERLEQFVGYVKANGRRYVDWDAAFMEAIRKDWAKVDATGGREQKLGKEI